MTQIWIGVFLLIGGFLLMSSHWRKVMALNLAVAGTVAIEIVLYLISGISVSYRECACHAKNAFSARLTMWNHCRGWLQLGSRKGCEQMACPLHSTESEEWRFCRVEIVSYNDGLHVSTPLSLQGKFGFDFAVRWHMHPLPRMAQNVQENDSASLASRHSLLHWHG